MGKKNRIRIRDEQPGSYFGELRNQFFGLKFFKLFDADPGWKKFGSRMENIRIRDPGWKKFGGIRDKHPGSATLKKTLFLIKTLL
jgi:hypothetical protein